MISDFVKGKKKFDYPKEIQQGITLHRIIDTFTDAHDVTRAAKEIFRPVYRLYSGAFIDVLYDHFLATDNDEFSDHGLFAFSNQVYGELEKHSQWHPVGFAKMFPHMRSQNWLYRYQTKEGIKRSLAGVVYRAAYLTESETAANLFEENYQPLRDYYRQFWRDLKPFARRQFEIVKSV
jgi:acyl carrier protein phosphodiesterase